MQIIYKDSGDVKAISGDLVLEVIKRTDLVPVPLTVEATIRVMPDYKKVLAVGKNIYLPSGEELEIIFTEVIDLKGIHGSRIEKHVKIIAVLASVAPACYVSSKAIIKTSSTLASIYRACGCSVKSITGDFALKTFNCLSGEAPTFGIARALQENAGVVCWKNNALNFKTVKGIFAQTPIDNVAITGATDVSSEFLKRHEIPYFYSVDEKGEFIFGNREKTRKAVFVPNKDEATLRNMSTCLYLSKIVEIDYTEAIVAGDLVWVDLAEKYAVITTASVFRAGVNGNPPAQFTKLWLGSLND